MAVVREAGRDGTRPLPGGGGPGEEIDGVGECAREVDGEAGGGEGAGGVGSGLVELNPEDGDIGEGEAKGDGQRPGAGSVGGDVGTSGFVGLGDGAGALWDGGDGGLTDAVWIGKGEDSDRAIDQGGAIDADVDLESIEPGVDDAQAGEFDGGGIGGWVVVADEALGGVDVRLLVDVADENAEAEHDQRHDDGEDPAGGGGEETEGAVMGALLVVAELGFDGREGLIEQEGFGIDFLDFVGVAVDLGDELFEASLRGEGGVAAFLVEHGAVMGLGELGDTDLEAGEAGIDLGDDLGFEEGDGTEGTEIGVGGGIIGGHAAPSVGAGRTGGMKLLQEPRETVWDGTKTDGVRGTEHVAANNAYRFILGLMF